MGMRYRSKTSRTPAWAMPRANPPPRARPILGGANGSSGRAGRVFRRERRRSAAKKVPTFCAAFMTPPSTGYEACLADSDEQAGYQVAFNRKTLVLFRQTEFRGHG